MLALGERGPEGWHDRLHCRHAGAGAGDVLFFADARVAAHLREAKRLARVDEAALRDGELLLDAAQLEVIARRLRRDAHPDIVERRVEAVRVRGSGPYR
jgi:hypothetical protein